MIRQISMIMLFLFSVMTASAQVNPTSKSICKTSNGLLSSRIEFSPNQATVESNEDDGHGGPDPLYFDSWTGVWVDPVSGLLVDDGTEFGHVVDTETGAQFYKPRGLWVDPKTLKPLQIKRLNNFPYYDPKTHETINPSTGTRSPYPPILYTIGASREAADRVRYACLGDNLRMRIDPATGKYLKSDDGILRDDTLFDTLNTTIAKRRTPILDGDRYVPQKLNPYRQFVGFHQYDTQFLRENLGLDNGISRSKAVRIIYEKFAPESPESGTYELRETRIENGIVTQITARGLMDDAISAVQILLFFDTSMKGRARLMNVGVRQKCGRPNSTEAWTLERC